MTERNILNILRAGTTIYLDANKYKFDKMNIFCSMARANGAHIHITNSYIYNEFDLVRLSLSYRDTIILENLEK